VGRPRGDRRILAIGVDLKREQRGDADLARVAGPTEPAAGIRRVGRRSVPRSRDDCMRALGARGPRFGRTGVGGLHARRRGDRGRDPS
jgi:hypothetical protein